MDDFPGIPSEIFEMMAALTKRMEVRNVEHRVRILESKTDFIADNAWLCWKYDDLRLFLCESPVWKEGQRMKEDRPGLYQQISAYQNVGRFNGYVRFPKCPLQIPGMRDIVTYVPVHGGVTYFQDWWDGSVTYGFDTSHLISGENMEIINDVNWMMAETESLARGIRVAARFERFYLNARDNQQKARVLERMGKFLPVEDLNMGMMVNLLCGEL